MTSILMVMASGLFLLLAGRGLQLRSRIAAMECIKAPNQKPYGSNRPGYVGITL